MLQFQRYTFIHGNRPKSTTMFTLTLNGRSTSRMSWVGKSVRYGRTLETADQCRLYIDQSTGCLVTGILWPTAYERVDLDHVVPVIPVGQSKSTISTCMTCRPVYVVDMRPVDEVFTGRPVHVYTWYTMNTCIHDIHHV